MRPHRRACHSSHALERRIAPGNPFSLSRPLNPSLDETHQVDIRNPLRIAEDRVERHRAHSETMDKDNSGLGRLARCFSVDICPICRLQNLSGRHGGRNVASASYGNSRCGRAAVFNLDGIRSRPNLNQSSSCLNMAQ